MAAAKSKGGDIQAQGQGRRREVTGICLLGLGVFSVLALVSMQTGSNRMMGPGGAAAAAGLYSLAGLGAYVIIAVMLVLAVRCFRGRLLQRGFAEVGGTIGVLASMTVLLHLPFADEPVTLHGPGGLLGQWLGEITATFIGDVGAALAAATVLCVCLLMLTDVRVQEILVVLGWACRQTGRGVTAAVAALGRVVVAMFPEKSDQEDEAAESSSSSSSGTRTGRELAPVIYEEEPESPFTGTLMGYPAQEPSRVAAGKRGRAGAAGVLGAVPSAPLDDEDSEAVRVGDVRGVAKAAAAASERAARSADDDDDALIGPDSVHDRPALDEERRAVAALVAEVAAVECAAQAEADAQAQAAQAAAAAATAAAAAAAEAAAAQAAAEGVASTLLADPELPAVAAVEAPAGGPGAAGPARAEAGPIIVEPAWRARQRREEEEAAAAAADDDEDEAMPLAARDRGDGGRGFIQLSAGAFALPRTEMLEYAPPQGGETDRQALYEMADRLEQAMANYGVRGKVKEIHMGPVVTMFEFAPAPGTRTGKIAQLENDLAMALEAQAVRIVAPIPGKAVVGVEVPNRTRETVYLKEILEDDCFTRAASKLQVGLGKDIKGAPVSVNLSKMPHLLVAGTTGSGKSVAVNSMITSVLYNATPEEVRFIMVDPKMLELSIYEGIPHLLLPVVTDPKKANLALRWAVEEMERRYEMLSKAGVRDIAGYNARIAPAAAATPAPAPAKSRDDVTAVSAPPVFAEAPTSESARRGRRLKVIIAGDDGVEQEVEVDAQSEVATLPAAEVAPPPTEELLEEESAKAAAAQAARAAGDDPAARKLPYIIIVIDEFADLMMCAPKDVETSVARLAQKARAAGLHLILATQRPSVDVITGLIKANFPSRIALQVASKIDSRTILDQPGAETLLGNGDMLFSDRGTKLRRIHGAFLSDDEVHRVVEFLKKQAKPVYDMDILKPRDEDGEGGEPPPDDFHDALYDQAVAIVCETRQASVSYIQRRLQIGYNRSARMVEQMERDGIVGPANGIKPREVLAPAGEYLNAAP